METKSVPISAIQITFQIRKDGNDEQQVQKVMKSIEEEGWRPGQYLDVIQPTPGVESYTLADGNHRLEALRRLGFEEAPVRIVGTSALEMQKCAYRNNTHHGKELPPKDRKAFLMERIKEYCGPVHRKSSNWLSDEFGVHPRTVKKYREELENEGFIFPESVIGKDGKEQPADRKNKDTGMANATPEKPDTPCHFCAGGCGTPIWEEMKGAPDSTYFHIQKNGMTLWFCSEECYRHSWHCPPDEKHCEDVEDDEAPVYVKCEHCGKTTTLQEAKDYRKSGWQPVDRDFNRWYCSEECLNAALGDETKPEPHPEPPAREPAPSSSQASGAEPEQEEPDEFTFTDVDEETLPVCTEEHKETDELETQIVVRVRTKAFKTAQEFVNSLSVIDGKFQIHLFGSDVDAEFLGLYENNNLINNNINTNPEIFTDFYVCCKSTKGRKVKLFISKAKYAQWTRKFGPTFDIDQNLRECCDYYNELTGSEMLSAGGVYSKVYAWLLKNWKAQKKEESKPKKNAYKDAGLRFDPSDY